MPVKNRFCPITTLWWRGRTFYHALLHPPQPEVRAKGHEHMPLNVHFGPLAVLIVEAECVATVGVSSSACFCGSGCHGTCVYGF